MVRGAHQLAFGVNYIRAIMNTLNNRPTNGQFSFSSTTGCAGCTGIAMADFMIGTVSGGFVQGGQVYDNDRANFIGLYAQDSWKINPRFTFNYGVRWEPFLPENNRNGYVEHFDPALFTAGTRSPQNVNSPAGLIYPGDTGFPGESNIYSKKGQFAPRTGIVWDPRGDGKMTVRASYGIFYDTPQLFFYTRFANNPPWGAQISLPLVNFTNPWATYPGGDPFPGLYTVSKTMPFPLAGVYVNMPLHTNSTVRAAVEPERAAAGRKQFIARRELLRQHDEPHVDRHRGRSCPAGGGRDTRERESASRTLPSRTLRKANTIPPSDKSTTAGRPITKVCCSPRSGG